MATLITENLGLVSYNILVDGTQIPDTYPLLSIEVHKEINRISNAKLVFADGGVAEVDDFPISNSPNFVPGAVVIIKAGYEQTNKEIFQGIVIKHSLKIKKKGGSELIVECKHKAVKMTIGRKNKVFKDKKDSDIITSIIQESGLTKKVEATSHQHKELVQHYVSDWDFVLMRADVNGLVVVAEGDKLNVEKPNLSASPKLKVEYGSSMNSFYAEIDARTQLKSVTGYSWDRANKKLIKAKANSSSGVQSGNLTSSGLAKVIGLEDYILQSSANIPQAMVDNWATAKITKASLAKLRGTVSFIGNADVIAGDIIELAGLSKRFNGNAYVSAVTHKLESGTWNTEAKLGLSDAWYVSETAEFDAPKTSGLLAGFSGLTTAIVTKIHEDEEDTCRIMVKIPTISENDVIPARLATFYASNNAGVFFFPEIDDEVIVGFLNESPDNPIILGSLYSLKNKAPLKPDADNSEKAIITKEKLKMSFHDKDKILTLETPAKNTIIFSDKDKNITIKDQNGNIIEMSSAGISFTSDKDIILKAKGNIKMEATQNVEMKATADLKGEGLNLKLKGSVGLEAKGGATTKIESSGILEIKGSLVKIN